MTVSRGQILARCLLLVLLLGLAVLPLGCGGESMAPVSGKVYVGDKLLTSGTVFYEPDKAKGNTSTGRPLGQIDANGEYTLRTNDKVGAPIGAYKVTIVSLGEMGTSPADMSKPPKFMINQKYRDATTSGITKDVVASAAPGTYDLKLSP